MFFFVITFCYQSKHLQKVDKKGADPNYEAGKSPLIYALFICKNP